MAQESASDSSNNKHAVVTHRPVTGDPDIDNSELETSQVLILFTRGIDFMVYRSSLFTF